jgi:hydroxymethylbilane synthase
MPRPPLRIGTRESKLARLQTDMVLEALRGTNSDYDFQVVHITTGGDKVLNKPIAELGTTGVFVKELEDALLSNEVDLVVHSLKDVPTEFPDGLMLGATLCRDDARDVLVSRGNVKFADLPAGSKVATSSRRRAAQLGARRKDLVFVDIRGNVPTRVSKLDNGECDAMVLAAAGLIRLGMKDRITQFFQPDECMPAAGQAALAVECRADDETVISVLRAIDDPLVSCRIRAEREFLHHLGGGCSVPIGVLATLATADVLDLSACIADGGRLMSMQLAGPVKEPEKLGKALAEKMLDAGAMEILETVNRKPPQAISPP